MSPVTRFQFANGLSVEREFNGPQSSVWRLAVRGDADLGPDVLRTAAAEAELFMVKMRETADKIEADLSRDEVE